MTPKSQARWIGLRQAKNGKAYCGRWISPLSEAEVHESRDVLPGKVRQRIKKLIDSLRVEPRPARSLALDIEDLPMPAQIEIWRIRLEDWRIIYAVNDSEQWVWVLAIHRRPPYDYEDLAKLASRLSE
jgi:mRNA interferase RelE/StbE